MFWREVLGDESLASVRDREPAVEMGVDIYPEPGIAAAAGAGAELEEAAIQLHGVVVLDGALVLKAADAGEIPRGRPPCRVRMRRGLREARIVAWEKPVEDALGLRQRAGMG